MQFLDVVVTVPVVANDRNEWVQTVQKRSGSAASAVLVVVDVAVSMRRQVPVLPGGASDQSIDKVVDCVCVFFQAFNAFFARFRRKRVPIFQPSSTHSCECSRARWGAGVAGSCTPR